MQNLDNLEQRFPAHVSIFCNELMDRQWVQRAERWWAATPDSFIITGWEQQHPLPLFLTALLLITSVPEIVNAQSLTTNGFGKGGKPKPTPTPSPVPTDPYWDVNGSTAGSGGTSPSGNWDLVTANWNNTACIRST